MATKVLFRGGTDGIKPIEEDGRVVLSWRHRGSTARKACEDRAEAYQTARATFPMTAIKGRS